MSDLTKTTDQLHSDQFIPAAGLPADELEFLESIYANETSLTDEELNELAEREERRKSTSNIVAVGNCKAVEAIIALFA